jgi:hypothetical protein
MQYVIKVIRTTTEQTQVNVIDAACEIDAKRKAIAFASSQVLDWDYIESTQVPELISKGEE